MHLGEHRVDYSLSDYVPITVPGPAPLPLPVASAWEWGALIAVALDGRPLSASTRTEPPRRREDRAIVAIVGALAIAAVVLSALLL